MEEVKKKKEVVTDCVYGKNGQLCQAKDYICQDPRCGTVGCPVGPEGPKVDDSKFAAPKDIVLSKEDRLEAENLNLRLMLTAARKDAVLSELQTKLSKLDAEFKELQSNAESLQHRLWDHYGSDFETQMVEPGTGRIIPRK